MIGLGVSCVDGLEVDVVGESVFEYYLVVYE